MIVNSLIKLNKGRAKICLDNGTDFVLYKGEYESYGIAEGSELTLAEYNEIVTEILIPRCKKRGLHLLEKQDRSRKNLQDKLLEGGYPEHVVEVAIDYIDSFGYIDDIRLASSYIRFYQDSRSARRIKQDLLAKGISSDDIDIAFEEEYSQDESELICRLMEKKHYNPSEATYEEKAKMYRFLASKGFGLDSINNALKA